MTDPKLSDLLERLVRQGPLDWSALEREASDGDAGAGLRRVARIAQAFGRVHESRAEAYHAQPPARFAHLEVGAPLGQGWDGSVYRALDTRLKREVALKLRRIHDTADDSERLLREARALAQVRHPHVLAVHGADAQDGWVGVWSDLLEGETLEQLLARGGVLGADEARAIGVAMCQALAAIHQAGLRHGDVKLANIMRERGGRIVLLDFGAARPVRWSQANDEGISGSPLYLAPEVLEGRAPDAQSDLYALGVCLYRLASAAYPVEAADMVELRTRHARGAAVPLRDRRSDLPAGFVAAIERAIAADPARRHASAGAFEQALLELPARGRRAGVMAVLALALVGAGFALWRAPAAPPLHVEAALIGAGGRVLSDGASIHAGDSLHVRLRTEHTVYLYAINEDDRGALARLFPVEGVTPSNPLAAGREWRIPERVGAQDFDWRIGAGGAREYVLLVATTDATPEFLAAIDRIAPPPLPASAAVRGIDGYAARDVEPGTQLALWRDALNRDYDASVVWTRLVRLEKSPESAAR
jgi:tRNA A-37 threonylcarbamoyl transferase component Bud32